MVISLDIRTSQLELLACSDFVSYKILLFPTFHEISLSFGEGGISHFQLGSGITSIFLSVEVEATPG